MSEGDWIEDEKTTDSGEAMFSEVFGEGGFDTSKVKSSLLPAGSDWLVEIVNKIYG